MAPDTDTPPPSWLEDLNSPIRSSLGYGDIKKSRPLGLRCLKFTLDLLLRTGNGIRELNVGDFRREVSSEGNLRKLVYEMRESGKNKQVWGLKAFFFTNH